MKKSTKIMTACTISAAAVGAGLFLGMGFRAAFDGTYTGVKRRKPQPKWPEPFAETLEAAEKWLSGQTTQQVEIVSHDGLRLVGHWLPADQPKRIILMMHGFRSKWGKDFLGALEYFQQIGCSVLLAEQRAHGGSEGRYITFGVLERYDCLGWLDYIHNRFGDELPVYAEGISMGAATVLMAAGLGMPEFVHGIIADCGFTSPHEIIAHVMKHYLHLPKNPIVPVLSSISKRLCGVDLYEYSTQQALENNTVPVLFIHGADDKFVPMEMTLENYKVCKAEKELIIVEGAEHGMSYLVQTERCRQALCEFFEKYD